MSKFSIDFILRNHEGAKGYKQQNCASYNQKGASQYSDADPQKPDVKDDNKISDVVADRKKRPRTAFTPIQVRQLEGEFQKNKYLPVCRRMALSEELGLTETQIKIWFQNRRTKWKRKYMNNLDILTHGFLFRHVKAPVTGHHLESPPVPSLGPYDNVCQLHRAAVWPNIYNDPSFYDNLATMALSQSHCFVKEYNMK